MGHQVCNYYQSNLVHFSGRLLKAYKSVYDAAVFCLEHGGRLAGKVEEPLEATRHCATIKESCAPSLLARDGSCYQWSPVDGSETKIPCNSSQLKTRFICEEDEYRR